MTTNIQCPQPSSVATSRTIVMLAGVMLVHRDGTVAEQTQSPLLSLPAELRLYIYELIFGIASEAQVSWYKQRSPPSVLTLLQTCRQVHGEAEDIFYTLNRIKYKVQDSSSAPTTFLKSLSHRRRRAVEALTLVVSSAGETLAGLQDLHLAPNLRDLTIERQLPYRYISPSSWRVLTAQMMKQLMDLNLRSLTFMTPESKGQPEAGEEQRKSEMQIIDGMLRDCCRPA